METSRRGDERERKDRWVWGPCASTQRKIEEKVQSLHAMG